MTNFQFGPVRSARSVFASSTEDCRNSLIVFDFSRHRQRHRHHPFGRRFGNQKQARAVAENSLRIFDLRPIENGVTCSVNP